MVLALTGQVGMMFLLILVGVAARKFGFLDGEAARQISAFLVTFVTPALMINCFQQEQAPGTLAALGLAAFCAAVFHLLAAVATGPLFPPRAGNRNRIERFAAICSNSGFMGIPLLTAALGQSATLYAAAYIFVYTIYSWTHGIMILRGERTMSLRALVSPGTVSALAGAALFLLRITLPGILGETVRSIAALNTPLSMMMMGVFIADLPLRGTFATPRTYAVALVRNVGLPLLLLAVLWASRAAAWMPGGGGVLLAVMICASCSCAASCIMMPARFGGDVGYGAQLIAVSTLLSIVTVPAVAWLSQRVLGV